MCPSQCASAASLDKTAHGKSNKVASHTSLAEKKFSSVGLAGGDSKSASSTASLATRLSNVSVKAPGKSTNATLYVISATIEYTCCAGDFFAFRSFF